MGVHRSVLCPACRAPRVTKASGRQTLTCTVCKRRFLARDGLPPDDTTPAAAALLAEPSAPAAAETGSSPAPAGGSVLGGVDVLPPAELDIGRIAFPVPAAAAEDPSAPPPPPPVPPAPDPDDPPPPPPAAVSPGPGRHVGYYGRIRGGR